MDANTDFTDLIESVSEWEQKEQTSKFAFFADNNKNNLKKIFNTFIDLYDISTHESGHMVEITLSRKSIEIT